MNKSIRNRRQLVGCAEFPAPAVSRAKRKEVTVDIPIEDAEEAKRREFKELEKSPVKEAEVVRPAPAVPYQTYSQVKAALSHSGTYKPKPSRPNQRPSLSEQLASIGQNASDITASIKKKAGITDSEMKSSALYSCPAKSFSVGNLQARMCTSLVYFYPNRCEYVFHHPYQTSTEIHMTMYYADYQSVKLANNKFKFHVAANLHQCFTSSDYDPSNSNHFIVIEFASSLSMAEVQKKVLPLIRRG
jgi:hypothetical protein